MMAHTHTHPAAKDCSKDRPSEPKEFSLRNRITELKSMDEIRPKVTEDLTAIAQKFQCFDLVRNFLKSFVSKSVVSLS